MGLRISISNNELPDDVDAAGPRHLETSRSPQMDSRGHTKYKYFEFWFNVTKALKSIYIF